MQTAYRVVGANPDEQMRAETTYPAGTGDSRRYYEIEPFDILHHVLKLNQRLLAPYSTHIEKQFRISFSEFRVLMLIGRLRSPASHEIAEVSGVGVMSISRAVSALQRHGRITVKADPKNRRRKLLRLTAAGEKLYRQLSPMAEKVARYLFESLHPDEVLALDRYLTAVIASLEARDEEGRSVFLERTRPDNGGDGAARRPKAGKAKSNR
jgi:DNA-binding MarR family transcriptional regulator